MALPIKIARGSTPRHSHGVKRTIIGLDGKGALDDDEQAEHGRQPHQARRHRVEHVLLVERKRKADHGDAGERQHLIGDDLAPSFDAQVFRCDEPGDGDRVHSDPAVHSCR